MKYTLDGREISGGDHPCKAKDEQAKDEPLAMAANRLVARDFSEGPGRSRRPLKLEPAGGRIDRHFPVNHAVFGIDLGNEIREFGDFNDPLLNEETD